MAMKFRFGSKGGDEVADLEQSLRDLQARLAEHQKRWAEQLLADPSAFADLEAKIHLTFKQLADHCSAALLAHAARQPACADAAKKT
jgi:hypothetical protein